MNEIIHLSYLVDVTKTDDDLVECAKEGNLTSVALLYLRYRNDIRKIGFKILRKEEDVEDLEVEMVLKLVDEVHRYQENNFGAWYKRVTRNAAYNMSRHNRYREHEDFEEVKVDEFLGYANSNESSNPEKEVHRSKLAEKIEEAMLNINENYREPLRLKFWEDLTYKEISERLGLSESNATARVHRGKKALKKYFSNEPEFILELGYVFG